MEKMKKGMTVKELIKQLRELNPKGIVVISDGSGVYNVKSVTGDMMLTGDVTVIRFEK